MHALATAGGVRCKALSAIALSIDLSAWVQGGNPGPAGVLPFGSAVPRRHSMPWVTMNWYLRGVLADHQRDSSSRRSTKPSSRRKALRASALFTGWPSALKSRPARPPGRELLQPRVGREQRHQPAHAHQPRGSAEPAEERLGAGQAAQQAGHQHGVQVHQLGGQRGGVGPGGSSPVSGRCRRVDAGAHGDAQVASSRRK